MKRLFWLATGIAVAVLGVAALKLLKETAEEIYALRLEEESTLDADP